MLGKSVEPVVGVNSAEIYDHGGDQGRQPLSLDGVKFRLSLRVQNRSTVGRCGFRLLRDSRSGQCPAPNQQDFRRIAPTC